LGVGDCRLPLSKIPEHCSVKSYIKTHLGIVLVGFRFKKTEAKLREFPKLSFWEGVLTIASDKCIIDTKNKTK
jgi:hypothetical protein